MSNVFYLQQKKIFIVDDTNSHVKGWMDGMSYIDHKQVLFLLEQRRIKRSFATGQSVWDPKFLSQINKKLKILK